MVASVGLKCFGDRDASAFGDGSEILPIGTMLASYHIKGSVTLSRSPLSGFTIEATSYPNGVTDSLGAFDIADVLEQTNYTITPSLAHYLFEPTSASGTLTGAPIFSGSMCGCVLNGTASWRGWTIS